MNAKVMPATAAHFPRCGECGADIVPRVSSRPICYQIGDLPPARIPRSQAAQALRFLSAMRPEKLLAVHLFQATDDSIQISRTLHTLRKKYGIDVRCDQTPKKRAAGGYCLYYLSEEVKVWEPENDRCSA